MSRKKILLLAYQVSPFRGSEYSVAWNYLQEMSQEHDITVIYGKSGDRIGEFDLGAEENMRKSLSHVHFIPIKSGNLVKLMNGLNRRGLIRSASRLAYRVWYYRVYRYALELIREQSFDLIHFLGPIGYREPGYLWKLPLPYLRGPVGGLNNASPVLIKNLPWTGRLKQLLRSGTNYWLEHFSSRIRKAFIRADAVLAATRENQSLLQKYFQVTAEYLPENGIIEKIPKLLPNEKFSFSTINLIWVGSLDARKSLNMLLEVLSEIKKQIHFHLDIVGDGPLKQALVAWAEYHRINADITWYGQCPRKKVFDLFKSSHVHVITSCMEGNPTTIWEAMEAGVPTVSLDHSGMHDTICEQCGIRIPIRNHEQIIADFASAICYLGHHPEEVKRLSEGALRCVQKYTWDKRRTFFNRYYDIAIARYRAKHPGYQSQATSNERG